MASYIHRDEKWHNFAWSAEAIADLLAAVSRHQGRLVGRMEGMGRTFREEAVLEALTEELTQSSNIEGETLDRNQVRSSLARRLGMDIAGL
jgi:Fic family protein